MTFAQLTYFKAICDHGTISKASQQLHVSSPAISVSIKNLEQECGFLLFIRTGSRLELTEEGALFYHEVKRFLNDFAHLSDVASDIAKHSHTIRYGTVPLAGSYLTPLILHNFFSIYPNENVFGIEKPTDELIAMVYSGDLDAILIPADNARKDGRFFEELDYLTVRSEAFHFATYPKHPLSNRKSISAVEIGDTPIVLLSGSYSQNKIINELFDGVQMSPHIIYRTVQLKTIERFITQGIASSFIYKGLAAEIDGIVSIPVLGLPNAIEICLIWRKNDYMFTSLQRFISSVKELIPYI